jgi:predicted negative regulator of RcsB-dependent stress response
MYGRIKKGIFTIGMYLLIAFIIFGTGIWVGSQAGNKRTDFDNEARSRYYRSVIADQQKQIGGLTEINNLQSERLTTIDGRLGEAADIVGELDVGYTTESDSLQRIRSSLSKLEQAISIIFADK